MADKKPDPERKNTDPSGSALKKKPRDDTDQSQGSRPRRREFSNTLIFVPHFKDVGQLPGEYEWKICDMISDEGAGEVYTLLKNKLVHDEMSQLKDEYSKEFLQWALLSPGFNQNWHIGVEDKSTNELLGFIGAVPANVRVLEKDMQVAEVKFIFVHEELRLRGLGPVLITEMAKRASSNVIYATPDNVYLPIVTCQCWSHPLNLKKLVEVGYYKLGENMSEEKEMKINSLPSSYPITGLRRMEAKDVPSITDLLRSYLSRFKAAAIFGESEVAYWFLPREDIVESYVVESDSGEITDFFSFYIVPFSILGVKDSNLRSANWFYNVSTRTQVSELLKVAMAIAKSKGLDTFRVLDVMDNNKGLLLVDLNFDEGLGQHYYLFRISPRMELISSQVGLVMF